VGKVRGCSSRFWKSASGPTARFFGPTARRQFFARFWSVGGQTATHLGQTAKARGQTAVAHGQTVRSPEPRWFWTLDGQTASRSGQTARVTSVRPPSGPVRPPDPSKLLSVPSSIALLPRGGVSLPSTPRVSVLFSSTCNLGV
jgi:hypothetical protein